MVLLLLFILVIDSSSRLAYLPCLSMAPRDANVHVFHIRVTLGHLFWVAVGAFIIVEMLFNSSFLAIDGAGEEPSLSPRRLCLLNKTTGTALRELNFLTSILAVRMNRKR